MSLHEALSRLLDDDLAPDEADALRARIASEPDVAEAWATMQAVVAGLEALPQELRPPPLTVQFEPAQRSWGWGAALALAAALVGMILWPTSPPEVVIGVGTSELDGTFTVLAADLRIDLDGHAVIEVEPSEGVSRGAQRTPQEGPMQKSTILAAAAGAVITVTMYEGTAAVRGDGEGIEIAAGDSRSFPTARGPAVVAVAPDASDEERGRAMRERLAALSEEVAAIEDELATERFAGQLVEAELERLQGKPSEWTATVPAGLRPDVFENELLPKLADLPGFELAHIDCSEYPCFAAYAYSGDDRTLDWGADLREVVSDWADGQIDDASISINKSIFTSDDREDRFLIFSVADGSRSDPDVAKRSDVRMDQMVDELGDSLGDGE